MSHHLRLRPLEEIQKDIDEVTKEIEKLQKEGLYYG